VIAMNVVNGLLVVSMLSLLGAFFTTNEELRDVLAKSCLFTFFAWIPSLFLLGTVGIALRFCRWWFSPK
jgi:hypothetical protein